METERLQDLSIYYWLSDIFSGYPQVTVLDGFPEEDVVIPSVVVVDNTIDYEPYELGNKSNRRARIWNIDIVAKNKAQQTEFASYIVRNLEEGIPVYDYNSGFPPTVVDQIGVIKPESMVVRPIRIFPDLIQSKMYWRTSITFADKYLPI